MNAGNSSVFNKNSLIVWSDTARFHRRSNLIAAAINRLSVNMSNQR